MNILQPGPGVGGHCIAVDPWFIVSTSPERANLIRTAREVNDSKPDWVFQKVEQAAKEIGGNPTIALLGLAFKADIDDLRESPALEIAHRIANAFPDSQKLIVEPNIDDLPRELEGLTNLRRADLSEALQSANVVVLLVDHREFRSVMPETRDYQLVDTRGLWSEVNLQLVTREPTSTVYDFYSSREAVVRPIRHTRGLSDLTTAA